MTKKSKSSSKTMLAGVVVALMGVLLVLVLFLPILTSVVDEGEPITVTGMQLLSAKALYNEAEKGESTEKYQAASDEVKAIYSRYYVWSPAKGEIVKEGKGESAISSLNFLAVLVLVSAVVGVLAVVIGLASVVVKKVAKYVSVFAVVMAVVGVAFFVVALLTAGAASSVIEITLIITASTTTKCSVAVGSILALVGGLVAAVTPFAVDKYAK